MVGADQRFRKLYAVERSAPNRAGLFDWECEAEGLLDFDAEIDGFGPNVLEGEAVAHECSRIGRDYTAWIQRSLNRLLGTRLMEDGKLGPQTGSAIRSFQRRKGLRADGVVGPKTERALVASGAGAPASAPTRGKSGCGCPACRRRRQLELEAFVEDDLDLESEFPVLITRAISAPVGRGGTNREDDVRSVQLLLNTFIAAGRLLGHSILTVDGKIGAKTIAAIKDFQKRFVGMKKPDGRVDPDGRTLEKLNGSVFQPTAAASGGAMSPQAPSKPSQGGTQAQQRQYIQRLGQAVEAVGTLPGFTFFALAAAYTESRWNSTAHHVSTSEVQSSCKLYRNARGRGFFADNPFPESEWCIGSGGWFGLMPATGLAAGGTKGPFARKSPRLIFDPVSSVVMLADLVRRLVSRYGAENWLAIRRGMASPGLVKDRAEQHKRSRDVRGRFEDALRKSGLPTGFIFEKPDIIGYPGAAELLRILRESTTASRANGVEGELSSTTYTMDPPSRAPHRWNRPCCCYRRQSSDALIEEQQFLPSLTTVWDYLAGCHIEDRTQLTPKDKRKGQPRDPKTIYALVLHQMGFSRGNDPRKYDKVTAHFAILPGGKIIQLHPVSANLYASNNFNAGSVAVEFAGNLPSTRGKCWKPETYGCHQLTEAQIQAGRCLVRHLIRTLGLTHILAHRQASGPKSNCPGPDIWYHIGQWAVDNLGLRDGGPGYMIGTGNPIPDNWRNWGRSGTNREIPEGRFGTRRGESRFSGSQAVPHPFSAGDGDLFS